MTATWSDDEDLLVCFTDRSLAVTDLVAGTVAVFDLPFPALGVAIVPTELVGLE
jgi:hypothetical protein